MIDTLDDYLSRLRLLCREGGENEKLLHSWIELPFWQEHELAHALYALLCKRCGITFPPLSIDQKASGAVHLHSKGYFPWGGLPYPKEHAELGYALALLGEEEQAFRIAKWQKNTLDHAQRPIYSLLMQEGGYSYQSLEEANKSLFSYFPKDELDEKMWDEGLGLVGERNGQRTIVCLGTGCKSGMGAFLQNDIGIINYGPQLHPLGVCDGFGLAGKASQLQMHYEPGAFSLSFKNRVSAPHPRPTGIRSLQDAGFSGAWIHATHKYSRTEGSELTCSFESLRDLSQMRFSFFCKAKACFVAKTHKLSPGSLDRYQGPTQPITLKGDNGSITLEASEGVSQLEVIPLAGDESFWGADFLLGFTLSHPLQKYLISSEGKD